MMHTVEDTMHECDWPTKEFKVFKAEPEDKHAAWFVVMPGGPSLEFNHHADDAVDEARARWVADALNKAIRAEKTAFDTLPDDYETGDY